MNTEDVKKLNSYLSFNMNEEVFGVNVASVLSILELPKITKIPQAPDYIKGMINLRGEVLPVVDFHVKLGMPATEITTNTCILVIEIIVNDETLKCGIMVDTVNEVYEIEADKILPPPTIGNSFRSDFIEGIYRNGESLIMLVNIVNVFKYQDLYTIKDTVDNVPEEVQPITE